MKLRSILVLLALLAPSAAIAADMLPLTRGIYVRADRPCRGASNASIISYWGGKNGLNVAKRSCRIDRLRSEGRMHRLERTCEELQSGGSFTDRIEVRTQSPTRFSLHGVTYRYCGKALQL